MSKVKITIVTPNYNGEKYLEYTLQSVRNQSDKDFEYIIIDGASSDQSHDILKKNSDVYDILDVKKDKNMFEALDRGIRKATGDVIIWINSDDILHKDAVKNVKRIFNQKSKKHNWINGITGYIKYDYKFTFIPYIYPRSIIKKGHARKSNWGYIQQESTCFSKDLYLKSGGLKFNDHVACDYYLWLEFAKYSSLETYYIKIGYFRSHADQISQKSKNVYEQDTGKSSSKFDINLMRLILSLIYLPYVLIKTFFIK